MALLPRLAAVVYLTACVCVCVCAGGAAGAEDEYSIDGAAVGLEFDGHGGLSAGASSRLLLDYPPAQRDEILDFLFKPGFGASLGVLKLEIGGDTQSTDGTEPSHSHTRGDLNCGRGYEGWLASEARKRNPAIRLWSLSWGVPGWVGNGSYFSADNIAYQVQWLKCLRDYHHVAPDYLGLWNERPQGSAGYIIQLRQALDNASMPGVGITIEATWQRLVDQVLTNPQLNASLLAATKHYPCNSTSAAAVQAHKKFWAGEDTPTPFGNWTGASCWGRKLNQHYIKMNSTSSVAWSVVWSAYPGTSKNFMPNAFVNATEPWSGHYDVLPSLWMNAHWHQFAHPGWRFLRIGPAGGSDMLAHGGSYVTLVPAGPARRPVAPLDAATAGTFTLIVETLTGACGSPGKCDTDPITVAQDLAFALKGPLAGNTAVHLWCSNATALFAYQGTAPIAAGTLRLHMPPDTICTATTLANGTKGQYAPPPPSARFPAHHTEDFAGYGEDTLAFGFADMYGSFAVRSTGAGNALVQVAASKPTGWAPTNYDPLTFIGDDQWAGVDLSVAALVNHTAPDHYVQLCGGCGSKSARVIAYGCTCCLNVSWTGNYSISGGKSPVEGAVPGFLDTWHDLGFSISPAGDVAATVDGKTVTKAAAHCPVVGMVALGCGAYHECAFRNVTIDGTLA